MPDCPVWERGDSALSGKPSQGEGYPYIHQVFLKPNPGLRLALGAGLTGMNLPSASGVGKLGHLPEL